jgi:hypothetical protein
MAVKKFLAAILTIFIASSASVRSAVASIRKADEELANPKAQANRLLSGTALTITEDNENIESKYALNSEVLKLVPTEAAAVKDTKIEDVAGGPNGQATPTSTQNPSAHHSHHLRNALIIIAIGAALLIGLAAAAK